jgi:hypothetical protein
MNWARIRPGTAAVTSMGMFTSGATVGAPITPMTLSLWIGSRHGRSCGSLDSGQCFPALSAFSSDRRVATKPVAAGWNLGASRSAPAHGFHSHAPKRIRWNEPHGAPGG